MRKNPETMAEEMSETERIQFIRSHAPDYIKRVINKIIMNGNKKKIIRKEYWKRIYKGKKIVERIIREYISDNNGK